MNKQEIFDKVARHLLTQNARSENGTKCAYRGEGEARCAVGCLISDENYAPDLEGRTAVDDAIVMAVKKSTGSESVNKWLLRSLQAVHDSYCVCEWRGELERVARIHGLSADVLMEAAS